MESGGGHTPKGGNFNASQQFSLNSTNLNTLKKTIPQQETFNNVTELSDEESEHIVNDDAVNGVDNPKKDNNSSLSKQ